MALKVADSDAPTGNTSNSLKIHSILALTIGTSWKCCKLASSVLLVSGFHGNVLFKCIQSLESGVVLIVFIVEVLTALQFSTFWKVHRLHAKCAVSRKKKTIKERKVEDGKLCGHSVVLKWSLN